MGCAASRIYPEAKLWPPSVGLNSGLAITLGEVRSTGTGRYTARAINNTGLRVSLYPLYTKSLRSPPGPPLERPFISWLTRYGGYGYL
ncbi:uncharacterized protein LAJ45_05107 [Morchella importuna]|uniref:uncharacterized protein n=1 Tax=Morchella importuna TaxID=1174673 RepID=UPI001E8E205A|nr:uncharacterized protein LAJ45_05107 [Morchella importuna]KAH8150925.1 hypothetical protein LAJ45_05107 [Morchella importuna]